MDECLPDITGLSRLFGEAKALVHRVQPGGWAFQVGQAEPERGEQRCLYMAGSGTAGEIKRTFGLGLGPAVLARQQQRVRVTSHLPGPVGGRGVTGEDSGCPLVRRDCLAAMAARQQITPKALVKRSRLKRPVRRRLFQQFLHVLRGLVLLSGQVRGLGSPLKQLSPVRPGGRCPQPAVQFQRAAPEPVGFSEPEYPLRLRGRRYRRRQSPRVITCLVPVVRLPGDDVLVADLTAPGQRAGNSPV